MLAFDSHPFRIVGMYWWMVLMNDVFERVMNDQSNKIRTATEKEEF